MKDSATSSSTNQAAYAHSTSLDAPTGDQLVGQLRERIAAHRQRMEGGNETLSADELAAAGEDCSRAVAAITHHLKERLPLSEAICSSRRDPIDAMLSEAFYQLRWDSHELALTLARRKREIGSIGEEEAAWLVLMDWEPEPPEWLEVEPALEELPPAPLGQIALGGYEPAEAEAFLQMLGRDLQGAWFRTFHARRDGFPHPRGGADLHGFTLPNPLTLQAENADGLGIYMVVGNAETASGFNNTIGKPTGAVIDADITSCPALFTEWDDKPKEWQITAWQDLGLPEPSFQIDTGGKSIHSYWVFHQPISPAQWRELQLRLIAHGGGDSKLRNPSRVMRVPGFRYVDKATGALGERTRIITRSGRRYGLNELQACLPELTESQEPVSNLQPGLQGPPASQTCDLPPRPLEQVRAALQHIPPRIPGSGTYQDDRPAALGYIHAVMGAGGTFELAMADLRLHHKAWTDIDQVIRSSDLSAFTAGSFWHAVEQNGGSASRVDLTRLGLLPDAQHPAALQQGGTIQKGTPPLQPFTKLIEATLDAIRSGDVDCEMGMRAELKNRFRVTDPSIDARLFKLLARQEASGAVGTPTVGAVELSDTDPVEWLLDGFVHERDQAVIAGPAGAGKTRAAVELAMAVIDSKGFLDHSTPARRGDVLMILSDGGLSTFHAELAEAGYLDHPALQRGPEKQLEIWAHSEKAGRIAWDVSIGGVLQLLDYVRTHQTAMVIIDSVKAVMSKAGLDYCNNDQVAALLVFFKEVVCLHTSVVWLTHDGAQGALVAGAKGWKEWPSAVHRLDYVLEGKPPVIQPDRRLWRAHKLRGGLTRSFEFTINDDGRLAMADLSTAVIVGTCRNEVVRVVAEAHQRGQESVHVKLILAEVHGRLAFSKQTVKNTLRREVSSTSGSLRRVAPVGHYALRGGVDTASAASL